MNSRKAISKVYNETHTYSEEDSELVNNILNDYYVKFGQLIAEQLKKVKPELQDELLGRLEDMSSVHGSCYSKFMDADTPLQQHLQKILKRKI